MLFRQLSLFNPFKSARKKAPANIIACSPQLLETWKSIRSDYFPERPDLDNYQVVWSMRRQLRTLASCNVRRRKVIVARELRYVECLPYLIPLLYHEMCHAVLGENVPKHRGKRGWHGPEFRALEKRHPAIPGLMLWIQSGGWGTAVRRARAREVSEKKLALSRRYRSI